MSKLFPQTQLKKPDDACELWLLRHAETVAAVAGKPFPLSGGHGDPELSELGLKQAEQLAERLKDIPFDALYVTSLQRTVQTILPFATMREMKMIVEPELREVYLGDWEAGLFREKVYNNDPLLLEAMRQQRWDVIPGAESNEALEERVMGALRRISNAHPSQRVLIVTHGGVIGTIISYATGAQPFAFMGPHNASISRVFIKDEWMRVRGFNDYAHLES